jgi:hypothetical protein
MMEKDDTRAKEHELVATLASAARLVASLDPECRARLMAALNGLFPQKGRLVLEPKEPIAYTDYRQRLRSGAAMWCPKRRKIVDDCAEFGCIGSVCGLYARTPKVGDTVFVLRGERHRVGRVAEVNPLDFIVAFDDGDERMTLAIDGLDWRKAD